MSNNKILYSIECDNLIFYFTSNIERAKLEFNRYKHAQGFGNVKLFKASSLTSNDKVLIYD